MSDSDQVTNNLSNESFTTNATHGSVSTDPPIESNTTNAISQIINLISNIDAVQKILHKNLCCIQKDQLIRLLKVLSALTVETKDNTPLNNILNSINEIFKDGKLEIHEIPLLIKVLNENVSKQKISNITYADFSLLLKLLIIILVELNILKLGVNDIKIINALIDASLELLNIQMYIPTKKQLFSCCL